MTQTQLIVFTRYPRPGSTKTRLIPALGETGAAHLQRQMTEHTLRQVETLHQQRAIAVKIWFAGDKNLNLDDPDQIAAEQQLMQDWLGSQWNYQPQGTGDLGARMAAAFQEAFVAGMEQVLIIGTDCPGLNADRLTDALQALQQQDLVLGDATDGGYYLLGLKRFIPELFVGIDWGTAAVLQQTVAIAENLGLAIAHLPPLTDIDRPEDLPIWNAIVQGKKTRLSIVVPMLNESEQFGSQANTDEQRWKSEWKHSYERRWEQVGESEEVEWIGVDGGSGDRTIERATAAGLRVISSELGRARQMNAGAAIAQGEILLFLHVDTQLPQDFWAQVQATLAQPHVVAGAFNLKIQGDRPGLRWIERGVWWRSHFCKLPYGDQAIFLKAEVFRQVGGFADLPIMEDFELVRRLQKLGRVAIAPEFVMTSGRRWQKIGVLRTTWINQWVILAYFLGISPQRIARWYRGKA
ncbi:MAG: TIGR04283 family arsenosugar biosynthesis glycosyltransferase [Oculatellaceae cyanobacterium Prado106]|nr:TIGR04283 family arsenosugar biosynthesis glycosyltransferase [Oculatellaceae cyanobacterium Prado106]